MSIHPNHSLTRSVPTSEEIDFLEDRLYEHNAGETGQRDGGLFVFFIRDEKQAIIAGVSGWTWARACEIRQLWVDPAWRKQGYGATLMEAAEGEARAHGCKVILLASYSFQAPEFYEKHGYEPALELADFPPGHRYFFLVKRLAGSESA